MRDVAFFTRQLVTMLDSGVPLHKALDIYAKSDETKLGRVMDEVADKVLAGNSLSASLSRFPRIFSPVYVGLVRAGEGSGQLNTMLEQLASLLERGDGLQRRLAANLTYPAFLLMAGMACGGVLMFYILPTMTPMFTTMGVTLPWPTRFLVAIGDMARNPFLVTLVLVAAALLVFLGAPAWRRLMARNPTLRRKIDAQILELPLLGNVLRKMSYARVLFTLSTLLEAGLPAATALHMIRDVTGNESLKALLSASGQRLELGCSMSEALDNILPRGAVQMIAVGEESSSASNSARHVAKVYEDEAEMAVSYFAALSEPLIMAGMGAVAAFIVLAFMLPLVSMLQKL